MRNILHGLVLTGFAVWIAGCDLTTNGPLVTINVNGVPVKGTVRGERGPVKNASVTLKGESESKTVKTDEQGQYFFTQIKDGSYSVEATAAPDATDVAGAEVTTAIEFAAKESITVDGEPIDVKPMELTGAIAGKITLSDVDAVGSDRNTGIAVYIPGTSFASRTDADGNFTMLYVQPGTYSVRAEKGDFYVAADLTEVTVGSARLARIDDFVLQRKLDTDSDGILDEVDPDDDDDTYIDDNDVFPLDASEWSDTDGDGLGDNKDFRFVLAPPAIDDSRTTFEFGFGADPEPDGFLNFECSLDGASFGPCGSMQSVSTCGGSPWTCTTRQVYPWPLGPLADGMHTLDVRVVSSAFEDPVAAHWAWEVSGWSKISEGYTHTCGIRNDGTLWCWGMESNSMNCDPDYGGVDCEAARRVGTASDWADVTAGQMTTCARKTNGTLWCWGQNDSGNLGDGTSTSRDAPVQVGTATDWTSVVLGATSYSVPISGGYSTASGQATCGLKSNGMLWCWGHNRSGMLNNGTPGADACLYGGNNGIPTTGCSLTPVQLGSDADWQSVTMTGDNLCAIKTDGKGYCWGSNTMGQLGIGVRHTSSVPTVITMPTEITGASTWQQLSLGSGTVCGRKTDGSAWCWGDASSSKLGAYWGDFYSTCPPISGFEAWCSPLPVSVEVASATPTDWTSIASSASDGYDFQGRGGSCGIRGNTPGQIDLWCWGAVSTISDGNSSSGPVLVDLTASQGAFHVDPVEISVGGNHGCAIDSDGSLWCWGKVSRNTGYDPNPQYFGPAQQDR